MVSIIIYIYKIKLKNIKINKNNIILFFNSGINKILYLNIVNVDHNR